MTREWWVDEARLLAGSPPGDGDLARLRADGFGLAVSLTADRAALEGWTVYAIPIEDGQAPSLVQACEFAALMGAVLRSTKSLVFCNDGLRRSAFMGAVYWIARGLSAAQAQERVCFSAGVASAWPDARWGDVLARFEQLHWRFSAVQLKS